MKSRRISILLAITCLFLVIFSLLHNQTRAESDNATLESESQPANQVAVSTPYFLRACVKELINQWAKKSGKELVLYEKSHLGPMKKSGPFIDFFVTSGNKQVDKTANATYQETKQVVALGALALAIYTHRVNPLKGLTITQIDGIFSQQRRCGLPFQVKTFGQLGLTGHWIDLQVIPFGVSSAPCILKWFQTSCLCNGHLNNEVKLLDTRADLFQAVSTQPGAIGFYLYTEKEKQVKPVAISPAEGEDYFLPTISNIKAGTYPLSANLYVSFQKESIDENGLSFLKFCLSKKGQKILSSYDILPAYPEGYNRKELPLYNTTSKKN